MPESLAGLLETAELAIASASQLAGESKTAPIAAAAALLRRRLDYPDDLLLVALAGGTGSGKSTILNALAGFEIAESGGVRPTTERPLAVASRASLDRVSGYLADLGITETDVADLPSWLCLIDLPDTDSVELDHRLQVDSLVAKVDLVVWVVDPEKYRDASLHHGYLRPLSGHSSRFLFALNQVDRLDPAVTQRLAADFAEALTEDGIEDATVIPASAAPRAGPPTGIDRLLEALGERRGSGVYTKAVADLEDAVAELLASIGRSGVDFEDRAGRAVGAATSLLTEGRVMEAADVLIELLQDIAEETGGVIAERIRSIASRVPRQLQALSEDRASSPPGQAMEERILAPAREALRERASAIALITDLSLSVGTVRSNLGV